MINRIKKQLKIYGLRMLIHNLLWEIQMRWRWIFINSFSQGHEDIYIDKLLGQKKTGFYVDIGAYDPSRFSNTKRFYLRGWRGINIEPDPIKIKKFNIERPKDTNLNIGIGDKNGILNFFRFHSPTLSTFSKQTANRYVKQGHKLSQIIKIKISKLSEILRIYAKGQEIDFFSIDTEGFDFKVLKSNNWKKFKPKVICIETDDHTSQKFLSKMGYKKVAKTQINSIYGKAKI